jgi:lipopolysaccharide transport system ATP-binding protein
LDADILVIDEALAVGDAYFTQKCMRFLREFRKNGTILFVSHDTASVLSLCHRAIWLEHGKVQKIGTAKDVAEAYLEDFFEANQGVSNLETGRQNSSGKVEDNLPIKDQRLQYINQSHFRNDLEIFSFDPDTAGFGNGEARIIQVALSDEEGHPLSWIVGGELVKLRVGVEAINDIRSLIIGFYIKDNLGQVLFGDNTYLTYALEPINISANDRIEAVFNFPMPILPIGNYSINAAVASGTQKEHIQHHWLHDAIIFKSHSSYVSSGLVGIPMKNISMTLQSNHAP